MSADWPVDQRSAREIVRAAGSNLAFALAVLPKGKRADMGVFYAFCRVLDDIVDEPGMETGEREARLDRWRGLIQGSVEPATSGIEPEMVEVFKRYSLSPDLLIEIVDGMAMDLEPQMFRDWEALRGYCYRAASAVGLVSTEIFGYAEENRAAVADYAEQLGYALQVTNILRDVAEDAAEGRVYLPQETLQAFGVDAASVLDGSAAGTQDFQLVMAHECERAEKLYGLAKAALPESERGNMKSPELMRSIYSKILARMKADGFRVFEKRYRLSKARMIWEFVRA